MKKRNPARFIIISMVILCIGIGYKASFSQKKEQKVIKNEPSQDKGFLHEGMSGLHKRLADAIVNMRIQPDSEGKYSFGISSGSYFDLLERQRFTFNVGATVYMNQGKIGKIVLRYYQFSMTTMVREVKTLTNSNPGSDDLTSLEIHYVTNTGETKTFKVGDLQSRQSQDDVISQYSSFIATLIDNLELSKNKNTLNDTNTINRSIQLGK
jgi:hypothetical protein